MHSEITSLDHFFHRYEKSSNGSDWAATASHFADVFLAAGPDGAVAVRAEDFARILPKRKQLFDQAGLSSARLTSKREARIAERYFVVDTEWLFESSGKATGRTLHTAATFIADAGGAEPKILAYIAHQDVMKMLSNVQHSGVDLGNAASTGPVLQ